LYEFPIRDVTLFDGQQNNLGGGHGTITERRIILQTDRGGTQQILLRDISNLKPEIGWVFHHLEVRLGPSMSYWLIGKDKNETKEIYSHMEEAMMSQM
jgi:hypothetical protein